MHETNDSENIRLAVLPFDFQFEERRPPAQSRWRRYGRAVILAIGIISIVALLSIFVFSTSVENPESPPPFELTGTWNDGFDTIVEITEDSWTEMYSDNRTVVMRHIAYYTNPAPGIEGIIIAQNHQNNTWFPSKWNRIHYFHYRPRIWHFCTVYYAKETQEQAETPPDHPELFNVDDPKIGCGGFPMSVLIPRE